MNEKGMSFFRKRGLLCKQHSEKSEKNIELEVSHFFVQINVYPEASSSNPTFDSGGADQTPQEVPYCIVNGKGRRETRPPPQYGDYAKIVSYAFLVANKIGGELSHIRLLFQVLTKKNRLWQSSHRNNTWKLVKPPQAKKIVGCKWLFKVKESSLGDEGVRYKACLVAKGYSQVSSVDFNDVFLLVVKYYSIQVLLALVTMFDLELEQLDVKTTFLHGDLEEQIYMQQSEGFIVDGKEDHVCLLKKYLYSLKQSPKRWYNLFNSFTTTHGYLRSIYDSCVYFKKLSDESFVYFLLYVDDTLIVERSMSEVNHIIEGVCY